MTTKKHFGIKKFLKSNKMNQSYILCKKVCFYSTIDEDMFFTWIKNISCIKQFEYAGEELYLHLVNQELSYIDMKNLIALLYRYKVDMQQLQPLITENNKAAIKPWKKQIFKK